jgi:hypothetical protein
MIDGKNVRIYSHKKAQKAQNHGLLGFSRIFKRKRLFFILVWGYTVALWPETAGENYTFARQLRQAQCRQVCYLEYAFINS